MGYNTAFEGRFRLDKPLSLEHREYLEAFSEKRHVRRSVERLEHVPDPIREATGLPLGFEGEFFIGVRREDGTSDLVQFGIFDSITGTLTDDMMERIYAGIRRKTNDSAEEGHANLPDALKTWISESADESVIEDRPPSTQPGYWCEWVPSSDGRFIEWSGAYRFYDFVEWLEYLIGNFLRPWGYAITGNVKWQGEDDIDRGYIIVRGNSVEVLGPLFVRDELGEPRAVRVFICHSSGDKPKVRRLYSRLVDGGLLPWFDEVNLLPGQDWEYEIRKAIRQVDAVLVCLSRGSANKVGYVQKEIRQVLDVADEQPEGAIFVIPVRLEDGEVPDRLRRWQWVDLYKRDGYQRLLTALEARVRALNNE